MHDEWTYTLEQKISIYLKRRGKGWIAIAWLDCGRDLAEGPRGSWLDTAGTPHYFQTASRFEPIIQHLPKASLKFQNTRTTAAVADNDTSISQNLRLLPIEYGLSIEQPNLASTDAFYALSELLGLSLASESQFLNMIRTQIDKIVDPTSAQMQEPLNGLRRMKNLTDDHVQYLQITLQTVRNLTVPDWPKLQAKALDTGPFSLLSEGDRNVNSSRRSAEQTVSGCEHLSRLAEYLSRQCIEGTNIIMNCSMLEESRKSIRVNEYLARLSVLAFLFLPLTFTTEIFGMNFREFGQGHLRIWIFFAILIPVAAFGTVLCFWNQTVPTCWR